jgi:glycosyltransferase involved in cell wall biosynthesis
MMVLSVVVLVVWLLLGVGMFFWGRGETLKAPLQVLDGDISVHTTLSLDIVVPARDEASVISRCVGPIVAGMEPGVSLIVVDDGSSDSTAKIATMAIGSANGSVVPAPDKPTGWAGKSWACQFGADQGTAEWILFLDADVFVDPQVLRAAIQAADARELSMLSLFGTWEIPTMPLAVTLPALGWVVRGSLDLRRHNRRQQGRAFANGQFILIRRELWQGLGGHAAVASSVLDDVKLATVVRESGGRNGMMWAPWGFRVLAYSSVSDLFEGYRKNFHEGMGRNLVSSVAASLIIAMICVVPVAAIATGLLQDDDLLRNTGLLGYGAQTVYRLILERRDGRSGVVAPVHWCAGIFVAVVMSASAFSKRVVWKGRTFDHGTAQ